jgi:peptidoglycan L-alanyl-D-glutamate endopeptidase CwlK
MFTPTSERRLKEVAEPLQNLMREARKTSPYRYEVTCGHRPIHEQQELYQQGRIDKTKPIVTYIDGITKIGKHNSKPSKAVDIVVYDENNKVTWEHKYYDEVAKHIKCIAFLLNVKVTWGGDFKKFKDKPHYEI